MKIWYYTFIIICVVFGSCKEESTLTTEVDRITQSSIIFEDQRIEPISDKTIKQVFYLVRHAEKDTIPKDNPQLTALGDARAVALADVFRQTRIDEVYSTLFTRTLWTVDTLSKAKGLNIRTYDHKELKAFAENLKQNRSIKSALIVGHSNSTPNLTAFLGDVDLETVPEIDHSEYDRLFMVVIHDDTTSVIKPLRFFTETI